MFFCLRPTLVLSSKFMPRYPKKSLLFSAQQTRTFPCPVEGCRTQVRSHWGFTQHVRAIHPGIVDLQYPADEDIPVPSQFPSSDVDQSHQTSSPQAPPSLNAFLHDEPDIHWQPETHFSDQGGPPNFDSDGNAEPLPVDLDPSEHPADTTEFHPLINGTYSINYYIILQLNELL